MSQFRNDIHEALERALAPTDIPHESVRSCVYSWAHQLGIRHKVPGLDVLADRLERIVLEAVKDVERKVVCGLTVRDPDPTP